MTGRGLCLRSKHKPRRSHPECAGMSDAGLVLAAVENSPSLCYYYAMSRIAIFIDGAYLDFVLKEEFSSARLDFKHLSAKIASEIDLLRTYYYHCLPYQSPQPTLDESERFAKAQKFFTTLERLPRYQVRLGKLAFRGRDQDGKPIFQQKRVDIMLGVDLALLSGKSQITHAALLAGDSDYIPAVLAAKAEGVLVWLYHGGSVHNDLWNEADERFRISADFISDILRPQQ